MVHADLLYLILIITKKEQRLRTFNRERVLAAQDELQMRIARIWGCKTIVGLVDSENPYNFRYFPLNVKVLINVVKLHINVVKEAEPVTSQL